MERPLRFSMVGSSGSINPYEVVRPVSRRKILVLINRENLGLEEIAEKLNLNLEEVKRDVEALKEAGLVKEVQGRLSPNFAIFTLEDYDVLKPSLDRLSLGVKGIVERRMSEVRMLIKELKHVKRGLFFPDVEYIIVGAITLDYMGLEVLSREGLLVFGKDMPGGGRYVFTGSEWPVRIEEAWMWGHEDTTPSGYWFCTHGKLPPNAPRMAFPDLAWRWIPHIGYNGALRRLDAIGEVLELLLEEDLSTRDLSGRIGRSEEELIVELSLLWVLDYVVPVGERWRLNRPFFTAVDLRRVKEVSYSILGEIAGLLKNEVSKIKEAYVRTSPWRNKIPFEEAFNYLYHIVFENALDVMIKEGVLTEPPLRIDGGKYSPFVGKLEER